ncbi:hypothetical protein ASG20_09350 [Sphingomonas sp. Leaf198]|nr:hypothetical protein ASG20_09350 [Sphingomonas sp. Leaf198]
MSWPARPFDASRARVKRDRAETGWFARIGRSAGYQTGLDFVPDKNNAAPLASVILTKVRIQSDKAPRAVPWVLTFVRMTEKEYQPQVVPRYRVAGACQTEGAERKDLGSVSSPSDVFGVTSPLRGGSVAQ